jgi:Tfp pilus assembly protein PilO
MKNSFTSYQPVLLYGFIFVGFIVSGIVMGAYFFNQFTTLSESKTKLADEITVLTERKTVLESVNNVTSDNTSRAQLSLPTENNSLTLLSQIRTVATELGLVIKNLDLVAQPASGPSLAQSTLNFDVDGSSDGIMKFIYELRKVAPIMSIDTLSLVSSSGSTGSSAIVTVRSPWAAVPTKLPALSEAIVSLSPQETELSSELASYRYPFTTESVATGSGGTGCANPFE